MRTRLVLVLAGALVLGACSDADEATTEESPTATGTATATDSAAPGTEATATPPGDSAQASASADLPDGVAARVGDADIATAQVQERVALVRELPEVQEQLQGGSAAQVEAQIERQVLGRLILQRVVLQGAAAEGIEVGDDRVEQDRAQMAEEAGGEEAFVEQLAQAGVPEGQVAEQLRASIAFELVAEKLLADTDTDAPATATEGDVGTETEAPSPTTSPSDPTERVKKNWLVEVVNGADVVVDEQYGVWSPATGQVVPN